MNVNGPRPSGRQERAQMERAENRRAAARDAAHKNYNRKVDAEAAQNDKAIDNAAKQQKATGAKPKKINSAFQNAKVDTSRSGNYNEMGIGDILLDTGKRAIGKLHNARVESERQVAKGIYKGYKKAEGAVVDAGATAAKAANHAKAKAKKAADYVETKVENMYDDAKTGVKKAKNKVDNFLGKFKQMWNES